jgi:hypothetical protein
LQHQATVEIKPQSALIRFTRRVRHRHLSRSTRKLLNFSLELPRTRLKSRHHPGNAGLDEDFEQGEYFVRVNWMPNT